MHRAFRIALLALLALIVAIVHPARAGAQLSVRPVAVTLDPTRGLETVTVRNEGDEPIVVRIHAGDWEQAEDGRHRFLALGDHPASCAGRLVVEPDRLILDPGREAAARLELRPGPTACWSVVFFENRPAAAGHARAIRRVAVQVHGVPDGAEPEGRVTAVRVDVAAGLARLVFENSGPVHVRPRGRLEVRSLDGEIVGAVPIDPFGVLPGHARQLAVPLPDGLPAGTLLVLPILDFGADHLAGGRALFEHGG